MHVTYHFEKRPGLKIDLIHLGVSWRQEENIWSTDQKFDFKVVWQLYRKKILVHWSTELHIYSFPEDLVKSEKEFKTVPTFLF